MALSPVSGAQVTKCEVEVVVGTLNHCFVILVASQTHLPSFYRFLSCFRPGSHLLSTRSIPAEVLVDGWWCEHFLQPFCGMHITAPPSPLPTPIFVDAFTSWGVGFILGNSWAAWHLGGDWHSEGRDIGWGEMVAIELALHSVIAVGFCNAHFCIRSDNGGIVGALCAGLSRNAQQNTVLCRIISLLLKHSLWFSTTWIPSKENLADGPSRGVFPNLPKFPHTAYISHALRPFVSAI